MERPRLASTLNSPLGSASAPATFASTDPTPGKVKAIEPFRSRKSDASFGHGAPVSGQSFESVSPSVGTEALLEIVHGVDSSAFSVSS